MSFGDPFRRVTTGQKFRMPATAYNAFLDAAQAERDRQTQRLGQPVVSFRQATIIAVRNASGADRNRFDVLGVDEPIIHPVDNLTDFQNRVALDCVTPQAGQHEGRFVILAEPLKVGAIGKAYAAGVCPVRLDTSTGRAPGQGQGGPGAAFDGLSGGGPEGGGVALAAGGSVPRFAEIGDGLTNHLIGGASGSATVLWANNLTGVQWAVIRFGASGSASPLFPVTLSQPSGAQGTVTSPATWTYNVYDALVDGGDPLAEGVNPVTPPSRWARPAVGQMRIATFGFAYYTTDDPPALALTWINEVAEQEACS